MVDGTNGAAKVERERSDAAGEGASAALSQVEASSGKGSGDENFPVASLLIEKRLRPHVMAFYAFARAADDIADAPHLAADDKIARLDAFEAALDPAAPADPRLLTATRCRDSLAEAGVPDQHARDLLAAFRQDATKLRYADWDELLGYCELSANPVGRFLLDLHGEDRAGWPASDALCTVLQVLNHIQDVQGDLRALDRVYVPLDWLSEAGEDVSALDRPSASPGVRRTLDRMLERCDALIETARTLPPRLKSKRLAAESGVIVSLAARLCAMLKRGDPIATRIQPSKLDMLRAAIVNAPIALFGASPSAGGERAA